MKFGPVPIEEAVGKILAHNLIGQDGKKLLGKGHRLTGDDAELLHTNGYSSVVVAALDPTDLGENEAARRVGMAIAGPNVRVVAPGVGRANLSAEVDGPLYVNVPLLRRLNSIDEGITIATLREHTPVKTRTLITLVKIIPFGIPAARVEDVEAITREFGPVVSVRPLKPAAVSLIISGPERARERLLGDFTSPVEQRIQALGSSLKSVSFVPHTAEEIVQALCDQQAAESGLIILAGISAIIDRDDVVPTALRQAGGSVSHFGAPVDPGSLLMLGYLGNIPVIGAPGCIKSYKTNIIDWILPRLLAGERLTHADLIEMGHGGLLDDIHERPMPRENTED
ncbi:MAG: molybdopterin-binding protein [Anaerolineae bacterium]|nr:molybdopterin-binding protein [Anaerolineae bacterium]